MSPSTRQSAFTTEVLSSGNSSSSKARRDVTTFSLLGVLYIVSVGAYYLLYFHSSGDELLRKRKERGKEKGKKKRKEKEGEREEKRGKRGKTKFDYY